MLLHGNKSTGSILVHSFPILCSAVRTGNLNNFNQTLTTFSDKFSAEGTYTLIVRLRHNVIKTGVRMINSSYSRISLADIADKLQLGSPEDAEFIIAKVIEEYHLSFRFHCFIARLIRCTALLDISVYKCPFLLLQRDSIACYAERCISYSKSVRLSVRLSVRHMLALSQNDSSYDHGVFTGG